MHNHRPEVDAKLDTQIKVLDCGFVELVDYMGSDERIVEAARVSYSGKGTKTVRDDAKLVNYLMKNEHWSPFEQVVLTFHIKLPIFIMRQLVRHRTARINEISGRYSELPEEVYIPDYSRIQKQDTVNKQGSAGELDMDTREWVKYEIVKSAKAAFSVYHNLLAAGVSRETARIVLPLNTYTEIYWQIDLRNLFNFLKLRLDSHAQEEMRDYARAIAELTEKVAPVAYASFREHILKS